MLEYILVRLIDSTPHATTTSYTPAITPGAAKWAACWLEPHCRSMVAAGTASGKPAAMTALRVTLMLCSPLWVTQPPMTSSMSDGSRLVRSTRASSTVARRSTGCVVDRPPPGLPLPLAVRTTSTMTASGISVLSARTSDSRTAAPTPAGSPVPSAAGDGRQDRDLYPGVQPGLETIQILDVVRTDKDVDVVADLAELVADPALEQRMSLPNGVEHIPDDRTVADVEGQVLGTVDVFAQRPRQPHDDSHLIAHLSGRKARTDRATMPGLTRRPQP